MSFATYLASTRQAAETEKEVLDLLHDKAAQTGTFDKIEIRADRLPVPFKSYPHFLFRRA